MGIIVKALGNQDMTDLLDREYAEPLDTCPFMQKGSLSVGWDGRVSPCPPLLHTHRCYFQGIQRNNRECSFGSLKEHALLKIWNDAAYTAFRKRVIAFDFTPCVACASCEMAEGNEEDCFGNTFPTCGGCLWAQGFIQCP
jgi:MoaA/NifB/PqqE/SkfB family radical SAM enzyme